MSDGSVLTKLCRDFISAQKIRTSETIYQSDRVIENAYELIHGICEVVGYYVDPDDDENVETFKTKDGFTLNRKLGSNWTSGDLEFDVDTDGWPITYSGKRLQGELHTR